jgi:hypothetical protein
MLIGVRTGGFYLVVLELTAHTLYIYVRSSKTELYIIRHIKSKYSDS